MTVIAFRPRQSEASPAREAPPHSAADTPVTLSGTFRSPSGRLGRMEGSLRVERLVLLPCGAFVNGVFTGRLVDVDGTVVGVATTRAVAGADLVRDGEAYLPVVRPFQLVLMGIVVDVEEAALDCPFVLPWRASDGAHGWSQVPAAEQVVGPT